MRNIITAKITTTILVVLITISIFCGCDNQDVNRVNDSNNLLASVQKGSNYTEYDFKDNATQPESYDIYINKSTELAIKMLRAEDYSKSNTILAPMSVTLSLSALENSMNNTTLNEVKPFLGKSNYTTDTINKCSSYITQRMKFFNTDTAGIFGVSSVWVADGDIVKRSFLQKYKNFYDIAMYEADFSDEKTNTIISNFIADNSNSLIPQQANDNKNKYKLYLDSSMAISDVWIKDYETENISDGNFNLSNGKTENVTYLTSVERMFKSTSAKGFVKDFKNIPCKLVCILPDDEYTLEEYVKTLTYDKFLDLPRNISATDFANVSLPEFSVERTGTLKNTISNIGISEIFIKDADFSKGFSEDIFVDDFTQSVGIKIDKNGCSVSSAKENEEKSENLTAKETIKFDKPFLYAVVDNESYAPIIIGTINNPNS